MVKINWLGDAKNNLKEIFNFIAADSKKYAKYQTLQLKKRVEILKNHPFENFLEINSLSYGGIRSCHPFKK